MQCQSCGTVLPPGAVNCPACGQAVSGGFGPFQETGAAYPNPNAPPYGTPTANQPNSYPDAGAPFPVNQPIPTTPYYAGSPPGAEPASGMSPGQFGQPYGAPQQPFYPGVQPGPGPGQPMQPFQPLQPLPPVPPVQPRSRGISRGMTITLIVLALVVMFSGFGLIYYSAIYHPAQLHAQATSTAQTILTVDTRGTALANAQATGTAIANANATATVAAQATAAVVATATALQNIYTTATRGTPALSESLSGENGSNWDIDQAVGGGGCSFTGGAYHDSLNSKGFYFPCIANNTNFSNFAFQVQMTFVRGDSAGLLLRSSGGGIKAYYFVIGSDGTFDFFVSPDGKNNRDLTFGNDANIKRNAGQSNLLTVVARGSNFYLYINAQYVGGTSDGTFQGGQIGFLAIDRTNPTEVAFSNLQIWKL